MPLEAGTRLGPYEILSPLGSGGMGDVYRARDERLHRDVALKVLPDRFAIDHDRMARFTREAHLLASLNHPNIAAIYGVEEMRDRSASALVLEFVDGETLAERIAKGPFRVEDAIGIALQIAEALEAAHEKSIIHRDLKPANVKITTQGTVKVLDFGLAKALEEDAATQSDLSQSPTMTVTATQGGVILGTAPYMAPEQARGKPADRRSDIWAFGVTLFEMLTAQRPFQGETVSDTVARILEREPDWQLLPRQTPKDVRKLLLHCLTKNVKDRLQAIGDARTLLQELIANPQALAESEPAAQYPLWKKILPWSFAALAFGAGWFLKPANVVPKAMATSRFEYAMPKSLNLMHLHRHGVEISPDGKQIAFVAGDLRKATGLFGPALFGKEKSIYVQPLDQWDARAIPNTEGAVDPTFSPDGQTLAFFSQNRLMRIPLNGDKAAVVAEHVTVPVGMSWGKNGSIVFTSDVGGPLKIVSETGGDIRNFTELDADASEISHRLPHFLPDGSAVLFTVVRYAYAAPDWKRAQIWVKSISSGQRKLLIEDALDARYAGAGRLLFARQGKLFAVAFDPKTLSLSGAPVPVVDGITHSVAGIGVTLTTGAAQYSVSNSGLLVYAPGSFEPMLENAVVWVDRKGRSTPVEMKPMSHGSVRIAPDGKSASVTEYYVERIVWIFDLMRGTADRLTDDGHSSDGVWSPDGNSLVYRSNASGPTRLYLKSLGGEQPVALTPGPLDYPGAFTRDGKEILYSRGEPGISSSTYDIYAVRIDEPNKVRPVVNTKFSETFPTLSPDGKWLAHCSDESGQTEVYVQPYPGPGRRVTISTGGGTEPLWSRSGNELFYRSGNSMMSVAFKSSDAEFMPEKAVELFQGAFLGTVPARMFDVGPDGRFLMVQGIAAQTGDRDAKIFPSVLWVVPNWDAALEGIAKDPKH